VNVTKVTNVTKVCSDAGGGGTPATGAKTVTLPATSVVLNQ